MTMRMMRAMLLLAGAALATPATAATNLVVNPNFDAAQAGWYGTMFFGRADGYGHNSATYVATSCVGAACTSTYNSGEYFGQQVATVAGGFYDVSLWVAQVIGGPSSFSLFWNGAMVATVTDPNTFSIVTQDTTTTSTYKQFTFRGLQATGPLSDLQIHGRSDPANIFFDDVSVMQGEAPAVPEPNTWAMMLLGFGLVAAAARRVRSLPRPLAARS